MTSTALAATLASVLVAGAAPGAEIRVAVASNFTVAMEPLAERFEAATGHQVTLASGSTGKHYAQILNGAPFDAFFAADAERPRLLEEQGAAVPGSRFTYAVGRLVLWSPRPDLVDPDGAVLASDAFRHLAIANPRLAPYGAAAEQVLRARGLWGSLQGRIVRGENVAQAYQFVASGNAELGFVAYAQLVAIGGPGEGSFWTPPQSLYDPVEQQAVLLRADEAARAFLAFTRSAAAREIIRRAGYETGEEAP